MATKSRKTRQKENYRTADSIPSDALRLYGWAAHKLDGDWYLHVPVYPGAEHTNCGRVVKKISYYDSIAHVLQHDRDRRRISKVCAIVITHDIVLGMWLDDVLTKNEIRGFQVVDELLMFELAFGKKKYRIIVEPREHDTYIKTIDKAGETLSHFQSK